MFEVQLSLPAKSSNRLLRLVRIWNPVTYIGPVCASCLIHDIEDSLMSSSDTSSSKRSDIEFTKIRFGVLILSGSCSLCQR